MEKYFKTNQENWDKRVAYHLESSLYNMDQFRKTKNSLTQIELDGLAEEVKGKSLLHLQCHFGQDTMSWTNLGANATGIDFSQKAIDAAKEISTELGLATQFITCNVYDAAEYINAPFDIVYTSFGATCWLPDLDQWAAVIDRCLKPGGVFYIAEFHPTLYLLNFDSLKMEYPYFNVGALEEDIEGTYADRNAPIKSKEYFWCHSIEETMMPFINRNYELIHFKEYPYSPFSCFPNMEQKSENEYFMKGLEHIVPCAFSLKMKKKSD